MKRTLCTMVLLIPFVLFAQTKINYNITGVIKNKTNAKYAYLVKSAEIFNKTPIVNSSFNFKSSIDLGDDLFKAVYLFVSERDNYTYEEVKNLQEQGVMRLGYDENSKVVVLEDISLEIENPEELKNAKIISGGFLTKQWIEKDLAITQGEIPAFVKAHPDSPISINLMQGSIRFYKLDIERAETRFGNLKELFALLTEKLRLSKQGVLLKKAIDEVYNP
jgi:hypothetical protein